MLGRILTAVMFSTAVAPAYADPRPLTPVSGLSSFAPAGEEVLVSREDGANVRVDAIPVAGGVARPVFSFTVPAGLQFGGAGLDASPQRGAVTIKMYRGLRDNIGVLRGFVGPLSGGWSELPRFGDLRLDSGTRFAVQVDGERIVTREIRDDGTENLHIVMRDPEPHEVPFASTDEAFLATFAGDLVAYRTGAPGELVEGRDAGDVLVVRDLRTGAVISSADLHQDVASIDLRPDGRVAAVTDYGGALYDVRPGAPPRLLAREVGFAGYAGDSLVYSRQDGLRVIEPSGRIRRFGAPTASLYDFATEGSRVFWAANGCLLVDDVSAPPAAAPAAGPCPRSEIALGRQANPHPAPVLPIVLRCVAAPQACRGTLRLTADDAARHALSRRVRFSIPAGHDHRLRVPLTGRGYRTLRREVGREGEATVGVEARTDDGDRLPDGPVPEGPVVLPRRGK